MYSRLARFGLAGYEDLNDAARLSADPTFRLIGSEKVWERGVALTSIPQGGIRDPPWRAGARGPALRDDGFGKAQSGASGLGGRCWLAPPGGPRYGQQ